MQTPGTYISMGGHVVLVGWLLLGWGMQSDPLPFEVSQISVVSGDEYAALVAASSPNPNTAEPQAPVVPDQDAQPTAQEVEIPTPPLARPEPVMPPAEDSQPPETPPVPDLPAEVTDTVSELPAPPVGEPDMPATDTPQEAQADRITSTPTALPPPDVDTAAVVQEQSSPEAAPDAAVVEEPVEEAAPEDTATTIVVENTVPSGAVETSLRPASRPARPTPPAPTPTQETTTASDDATDPAVAAALEAATAAATTAASSANVAEGPPMTGSEKDGFRVAVNGCWNVDPGSAAARVTVEVGFSLDQSGRVTGDVRLLSSDGDSSAVDIAFQAARRAILRCQTQNGYQLPADKYQQWKDVVITFDPSGMRLR